MNPRLLCVGPASSTEPFYNRFWFSWRLSTGDLGGARYLGRAVRVDISPKLGNEIILGLRLACTIQVGNVLKAWRK